MLELKWKIEGETQLARRLSKLGGKVKDFSPEFRKSANFLKDFFRGQVFDTRGSAIGEPWKSRRGAYSWPLLQRSGRMRKGFKAKARRLSGEVWNAVEYFMYHQSRKRPRRRLPRRIMMKLTEQLKNKIVKFFHEGLWKKIQKTKYGI